MKQLDTRKSKSSYLSALLNHDRYTFEHSIRVANLLYNFSILSGVPEKHALHLYEVGALHDIGKLNIPQNIITKTEPLTKKEFEIVKKHPIDGLTLLLHHDFPNDYLDCVAYHHENIDGSGYPYGIKGNSIPLFARMLRIVDSYDAMTSQRTYSECMTEKDALDQLEKGKGTYYEPLLVDMFIDMINKN